MPFVFIIPILLDISKFFLNLCSGFSASLKLPKKLRSKFDLLIFLPSGIKFAYSGERDHRFWKNVINFVVSQNWVYRQNEHSFC